jgi:hypothetical protein
MNNATKDVSLFVKFKDPDEAAEAGHSVYLIETDTGKWIDEQMDGLRKWIAQNFDHDKDPLWPKHGNQFVCDLFEARHMGDDEFVMVWRDVVFTYYKRFGRGTYVSRALDSEEAAQFINEFKVTVEALAKETDAAEVVRVAAVEAAKPPPTAEELAKAAEDKAQADQRVAEHDADLENNYSLEERRRLLAQAKNYTATLRPILTLDYAESIIALLEEEGIPHTRPAPVNE